MADNDIVEEFTVEHGKRTLVASAIERIRLLFNVLVHFSSPEESAVKSGFQWLAVKGEKESLAKAKVCRNTLMVLLFNNALRIESRVKNLHSSLLKFRKKKKKLPRSLWK